MRQRLILVTIALVASVVAAEIAVYAQHPAGSTLAQSTNTHLQTNTSHLAGPTATIMPTSAPTTTELAAATMPPAPADTSTRMAWIVTARQAVPQGTLLRPAQVNSLFQRTSMTPPAGGGTIATLNDLAILLGQHGRVITTTLLADDPITLADVGLGVGEPPSLANQIPAGGVAVSLQINGAAALQGVVSAGDDVDVMAVFPATTGQGSGIQVRRLTWARVIALGPLANEVTVMIPNAASETVISADELGAHFHLVLRSSQSPELLSPTTAVPQMSVQTQSSEPVSPYPKSHTSSGTVTNSSKTSIVRPATHTAPTSPTRHQEGHSGSTVEYGMLPGPGL